MQWTPHPLPQCHRTQASSSLGASGCAPRWCFLSMQCSGGQVKGEGEGEGEGDVGDGRSIEEIIMQKKK